MIIRDTIERAIDEISRVYDAFADQMTALYISHLVMVTTQTLATPDHLSQASRSAANEWARQLRDAIFHARKQLREALATTLAERGMINPSVELQRVTDAIWGDLSELLVSQLYRDARALSANLLRFQLRVQLLQSQSGLDFQNALVSEREREIQQVGRNFKDRAGRGWHSAILVYVATNQALFEDANTTLVRAVLINGGDTIQIRDERGELLEPIPIAEWFDFAATKIHPRAKLLVSLE